MPRKNTLPSAQDLYERYLVEHDRNGVTVRDWNELGRLEKQAWEAVARYVCVLINPLH